MVCWALHVDASSNPAARRVTNFAVRTVIFIRLVLDANSEVDWCLMLIASLWQGAHNCALMPNLRHPRSSIFWNSPRQEGPALALVILFALTLAGTRAAHAQTFNVIHTFSGGADGANPFAGVTIDGAGNLYGTASAGGIGYGTVFRLSRLGSSWILAPFTSLLARTMARLLGQE